MVDYLKPGEKPVEMTAQLYDQISGWRKPATVPAGLVPYMHLPSPDPKTVTRARMAVVIERAWTREGCVTESDLAEFTADEIREHLEEARRIAGVGGMAT